MDDPRIIEAARGGDEAAFQQLVRPLLRELRAHCYRMSGSLHEAEDLLQESLLRAWRSLPGFEGRSSLRTWLYRVTTSACLDALDKERRRVLPRALGPASNPVDGVPPVGGEIAWLEPWTDDVPDDTRAPEALVSSRESISLAFLTVLQTLPARQRAVLLLRDVVGWSAEEAAALLGMSTAAVNSALQRAREALARRHGRPRSVEDDAQGELLARYVRAWESADVDALVSLLHEDATLSMPPLPSWFAGARDIGAMLRAMVLTPEARGRFRLTPVRANGEAAFEVHEGPRLVALHVVTVRAGKIEDITAFLRA